MNEIVLKELHNDLRHMDEPELLAFGRKHRANPDSVEYQEAKAAWKRKQANRKARELEHRQTSLPVESSWDTQRIAFFNRDRDVFPWVGVAIVKKDHFQPRRSFFRSASKNNIENHPNNDRNES
jgi:hypothetical protein